MVIEFVGFSQQYGVGFEDAKKELMGVQVTHTHGKS
jgi:hypothetical protein